MCECWGGVGRWLVVVVLGKDERVVEVEAVGTVRAWGGMRFILLQESEGSCSITLYE